MALRFSPTRGAASLVLNALTRGPQGASATLAAGTTTTLAAGASATVGNSGSTSAAVFDIGIPRGADAGLRYAFESSTSMAAPASGGFRANNATLASATAFAVSAVNSDGVDVSDWIATWDDSTNTAKGSFLFRKEGSGAVEYIFTVTSVVDNSTWLQINGAFVSGAGALAAADKIYLTPSITGNKGADGSVAGPGVSVDSEVALFSGTGGATLKRATGSGLAKLTSGVLGVAAAGTDYAAATSGSAILKGNGAGGFSAATAGTDYLAPPSGTALLKANSGGALANATAGTDYLDKATSSQLSAGYYDAASDLGTKSSGTVTLDPTVSNIQTYTNGGAHTLAPWASKNTTMVVDITNNGSAGAITTSGWTKVDGDAFDTTNTHVFRCYCSVVGSLSHLNVKRMA